MNKLKWRKIYESHVVFAGFGNEVGTFTKYEDAVIAAAEFKTNQPSEFVWIQTNRQISAEVA